MSATLLTSIFAMSGAGFSRRRGERGNLNLAARAAVGVFRVAGRGKHHAVIAVREPVQRTWNPARPPGFCTSAPASSSRIDIGAGANARLAPAAQLPAGFPGTARRFFPAGSRIGPTPINLWDNPRLRLRGKGGAAARGGCHANFDTPGGGSRAIARAFCRATDSSREKWNSRLRRRTYRRISFARFLHPLFLTKMSSAAENQVTATATVRSGGRVRRLTTEHRFVTRRGAVVGSQGETLFPVLRASWVSS